MTFYDRLQAAIACNESPHKAPASKQLNGVPCRSLGVLPTKLRGLWCLICSLQNEVEEVCNTIRRRELGYDSEEEVRDDHDHTEMVVHRELSSDPKNREVVNRTNLVTRIFIEAVKEIFPDEQDIETAISYNWWHIDESWSVSLPKHSESS